MASVTIVFTDNIDGTVTVSSAQAPFQKVVTYSSTQATDVAQGWIKQAIPSLQS